MDFKVDYNKINEISVLLNKNIEELATTLNEMLKIINELSNYWDGIDYTNFKTQSTNYIKEKKIIVDSIVNISNFMKKAADRYSQNDIGWQKEIRKIGEEIWQKNKI